MLKLKLAAAAGASVLASLAVASGAQAAYQDPAIVVNVSDSTPVEGTNINVSASAAADCEWAVSFDGTVEEGTGTAITASFTAPNVDQRTDYPLVVRCQYDDTAPVVGPADSASALATPAAIQTTTRTVTITVLPKGDDGVSDADESEAGALPNTGGSNAQLLLIGGGLVVAGVGITVAARRRGARA
jgi:LPXTG-motif cell wall-anchored protein